MTTPTITVSLDIGSTGAQQTLPVVLWANLITLANALDPTPGLSVLPSGLIEDIASTSTAALALIDAAVVEFINSLDPLTANPWLLTLLGQIYGVAQGLTTNGSAFVIFSSNSPGFQITPGWLVTDGTNYYAVQEGTIIGEDGSSGLTFVVATQPGMFAIPANSIDQTVTQPPAGEGITLTVTNPEAGTPQAAAQTEWDYRTQVLAAGLVASTGTASMLKKLLTDVPGVQPRLVAAQLKSGRGWEVIAGGGDPYAVAQAIFDSGIDLSTLVGSETQVAAASLTDPCVITTNINHGYTNHEIVTIMAAQGLTAINGTWTITTTSLALDQLSIAFDATGGPAYSGGGLITPNNGALRNITVDINSYPDTYPVVFVSPPAQAVTVQLTYFSISPNFVSSAAVQQLGAPAIANYINTIPVGAPLNINALSLAFTTAVLSLFGNNIALISDLAWTISVDGVETAPEAGTFLILGDPESYFTCSTTNVTITQG